MHIPYELALKVIAALGFKNEPITSKYIYGICKKKIHESTIHRALRFAVNVKFLTVDKTGPRHLYSRGSLSVEEFERLIPDEILNAAGLKVRLFALEKKFEDFKKSIESQMSALNAARIK